MNEYVGGYTDYLRQRKEEEKPAQKKQASAPKVVPEKPKSQRNKLTYKDQRDLDRLPEVMEKLEVKIQELETALADPDLFTKSPDKFQKVSADHAAAQQELSDAEERWLELEIMQEELNS